MFLELEMQKVLLAHVFTCFEAQTSICFTFLNSKWQEKKQHTGCQQLYTNMQDVSNLFKGETATR